MAKNIEIKASLDNVDSCLDKAKSLSGDDPEIIKQEDFFFNCDNGRLKLRIFSHQKGELIFYNRKNEKVPKTSEYFITETDEPDRLLQVLEKAYGIHGIVRKTRKLFLIGRTRVHIDNVENLGDFLEFEVVLSENENTNEGKTEAHRLMDQFGIENDDLIECAYVDLINDMNFLQRSRFAPR
jgi:predicted adenylyl cyclase CyaB